MEAVSSGEAANPMAQEEGVTLPFTTVENVKTQPSPSFNCAERMTSDNAFQWVDYQGTLTKTLGLDRCDKSWGLSTARSGCFLCQ